MAAAGGARAWAAPEGGAEGRTEPLDLLETLLAAMGERLRLQALVARAKWNSGAPIEDPPREAAVIEAASAAAVAAGADPDIAAAFFRAQIEAGKAVQHALFDAWTAEDRPPFPDAPDLAADLRPRFDALTPRLAETLAALLPHLADPDAAAIAAALPARAAHHLAGEGVDREIAAMAIAPLHW